VAAREITSESETDLASTCIVEMNQDVFKGHDAIRGFLTSQSSSVAAWGPRTGSVSTHHASRRAAANPQPPWELNDAHFRPQLLRSPAASNARTSAIGRNADFCRNVIAPRSSRPIM
jgi:hypothetical protein